MSRGIIMQADTYGGLWTGLDATPTGTDATAIMVADFTGAAETLHAGIPSAPPLVHTPSQTLGSTFRIPIEGVYVVQATVQHQTASSLLAAILVGGVAAQLNTDPGVRSLTIKARSLSISVAADGDPMSLITAPFVVTRRQALDTTGTQGNIVRLLLSNNAGAGGAAAAILLASTAIEITRVGEIPQNLRKR